MVILFPCAYGNLKVVDDDYRIEKEIADKYGLKSVLFNYDEYVSDGRITSSLLLSFCKSRS